MPLVTVFPADAVLKLSEYTKGLVHLPHKDYSTREILEAALDVLSYGVNVGFPAGKEPLKLAEPPVELHVYLASLGDGTVKMGAIPLWVLIEVAKIVLKLVSA